MRRLNVKLAIILTVCVALLGVGIHFLHAHQVKSSAASLPDRAQAFKDEGRYEDAYVVLRRYTIFKPEDEAGWDRLADFLIEWLEKLAGSLDERRKAYFTLKEDLEAVIREYPEKAQYRRKLAEWLRQTGQLTDARAHYKQLVADDPNDIESRISLAICDYYSNEPQAKKRAVDELYSLVGYDPETRTFDPAKGKAKDKLAAYNHLAEFLRQEINDPSTADGVLDAMVAANPDKALAYLIRGQSHMRLNRDEKAQEDIAKAQALDTEQKEIDILIAAATLAIKRNDIAKAEQTLSVALKKFPENALVYYHLIMLSRETGNLDKAIAYAMQALAVEENKNNPALLSEKALLQAERGEVEAAEKTLELAKEANAGVRSVEGDVVDAYITLRKKEHVDALRKLETLRPTVARTRHEHKVNNWLAECYGHLHQWDKQVEIYERLLDARPDNVALMLPLSRSYSMLGKNDLAFELLKKVRKAFGENEEGNRRFCSTPQAWGVYFDMALRQELAKPERNQKWDDLNGLLNYVERYKGATPLTIEQYRLDILWRQNKIAELRTKLDALLAQAPAAASNPGSLNLWLMHVRLLPSEKGKEGLDQAFEVLDGLEKTFGNVLAIRIQRAQLITMRRGPDMLRELGELESNVDEKERVVVWRGLAQNYLAVGAGDEVKRLWKQVISAEPNDLQTRIALFELSMQTRDEAGMDQGIKEIEKLMGKENEVVLYCKAMRLVNEAAGAESGEAKLNEARELIKAIVEKRPKWHLPARVESQICLMLDDRQGAINQMNRALDLGPAEAQTIEKLARLHFNRAEYELAHKAIARLGEARMPKGLRQLEAELALVEAREKSQEPKQAADLTASLIGDLEKDEQATTQDYLWHANMLRELRQAEPAEAALRKAIEKNPNDANISLSLVQHLADQRKFSEASDVIRDLELKLSDDALATIRPRCYIAIGKYDQAERLLKDLVLNDPKSLANLQSLAEYYQTTRQPKRAEEQLDKMLAIGGPRLDPNLIWARRNKAAHLAATGEFPDFEEAMKLIKDNYVKGEASLPDLALEVQFLTQRGEFTYLDQAIKRILEIRKSRNLPPDMQLMLAELYNRTNQWDLCRDELYDLAKEQARNPQILSRIVSMFLEQKELYNAQQRLDDLKRRLPNEPQVKLLQARIDAAQGDTAKAIRGLTSMIPPPAASPSQETNPNLNLISIIAGELARLKEVDRAEALYRRIVAAKPDSEVALASFLASRREPAKLNEALTIGDRLSAGGKHGDAMSLGAVTLQLTSGKLLPAQIEKIKSWYAAADRQNPGSVAVMLQKAQLHDLLGDPMQSLSIYRDVIAKPDLDVSQRGLILNNAAYVSAANGGNLDEALVWVEESLRLLGMKSEVLDTRGMVYFARGEFTKAIDDLRASVRGGPTATKNFHLALAENAAGNKGEAATALQNALTRGLNEDDMTARDRQMLAKLKVDVPVEVKTDNTPAGVE
jgi:tetratricopeptide (TPR) repeat protein